MIKKIRLVSNEEIISRAESVHEVIPDSIGYVKPRIILLQGSYEWYLCNVHIDLIKQIPFYLTHKHNGFVLIQQNETIELAAGEFPERIKNYTGDMKCPHRIQLLRDEVANGKDIGQLFLQEKSMNPIALDHIDGLHRSIALILENITTPIESFVAFRVRD